MNPISHLKDKGKGERVFLIGNGPSLLDTELDSLCGEQSIGMNRIDLIYSKTKWRPTYYVFSSTNCMHPAWGSQWCRSVSNCAWTRGTTPLIYEAMREPLGDMPADTIWLSDVTEAPIGHPGQFSTDAAQRIDKSGTTMNLALQLAYYMGFDQTYLLGCDSNWQSTPSPAEGEDPNHFDPSYRANIPSARREFWRMNTTHKIAAAAFRAAGKEIYNATPNSALTAYETTTLEEIL